jgi:branched-chain amino acid transport system ATP-binding protein
MSDLLEIEALTSGYEGKVAIEGISLAVAGGSLTALLGANGAGKSTLMKAVAGLIHPFSGRILFDGKDITGKDARLLVKSGISYVPEGRAIARSLSVRENLLLGGMTRSAADNRVQLDLVMSLFPEIAERQGSPAWQLSGGQQQMLAIGRALMSRPRLLLLDEPSLGLAPLLVKRVFDRLGELRTTGLTILLVEQNYWITMKAADCAYFMRSGRIVGRKEAAEMRAAESLDDILSAYLGASKEKEGHRDGIH